MNPCELRQRSRIFFSVIFRIEIFFSYAILVCVGSLVGKPAKVSALLINCTVICIGNDMSEDEQLFLFDKNTDWKIFL